MIDLGEVEALVNLKSRRNRLPDPVRQQVEERFCCLADPTLDCGDCLGIIVELLDISRTHQTALGLSP